MQRGASFIVRAWFLGATLGQFLLGIGPGLLRAQPEKAAIDLEAIPSPRILPNTQESHYRDPAALYHEGEFHLFFTVNQARDEARTLVSFLGTSRSRDLVEWSEVEILTPEDRKLNYSSPGNVIRYGGEWIICLQSYPTTRGGYIGDSSARLFIMRSRDLETWSAPELLRVKGPGVPLEEMGRMIDPYLLEDKNEKGKWWCFYKQNGVSMSWTRDFETWTYHGSTRSGENVSVIVKDGRYIIMHSPGRDGMGLLVSDDLTHFEPYGPSRIRLGYGHWPWARRRLTAGTLLDLTAEPRVGKYLMFYHATAGGPHEHIGGCSLGIAWSDDLESWDWPGKAKDLEKWDDLVAPAAPTNVRVITK